MPTDRMDDEEIRRRYRNMKKLCRIKILAELNEMTEKQIKEIVADVKPIVRKAREKQLRYKIDNDKALELYSKGATDLKLALIFNCSKDYIGNWRRKHKLPCLGTGRKGAKI